MSFVLVIIFLLIYCARIEVEDLGFKGPRWTRGVKVIKGMRRGVYHQASSNQLYGPVTSRLGDFVFFECVI